jgi:D-arabinose 1-dehydrogenase-like Zn-dependent alcohol dehydrogenase
MESTIEKKYDHEIFKHVSEGEAESVAWAFVNPVDMVKFPYKVDQIGEEEVRCNITYAGLCLSDILHSRSKWGRCQYPVAPGHEIMGVVSKVGSKVTDFKEGDKVCFGTMRDCCDKCKYCERDQEQLCLDPTLTKFTFHGKYWGGYSTHLQQPAKFFFKYPEELDESKAAPLLCAGITVYSPISEFCKKGDKTAVIGIGGLGHLAVQFLSKLGYHVTALTSSSDKTEFCKTLGADEVYNYTSQEDMSKLTNSFDFVINTLPISEGFDKFLNVCAPRAYFVQVGLPEVTETMNLPYFPLVGKELKVVGSSVGSRKVIVEMLSLCAKEKIYPMVEEFSFEDFPKAVDRLENGRPKFRCVVNVQEYSKKHGLFE